VTWNSVVGFRSKDNNDSEDAERLAKLLYLVGGGVDDGHRGAPIV
jgi:hypothetical protein